jgi:hypothetical protein
VQDWVSGKVCAESGQSGVYSICDNILLTVEWLCDRGGVQQVAQGGLHGQEEFEGQVQPCD